MTRPFVRSHQTCRANEYEHVIVIVSAVVQERYFQR